MLLNKNTETSTKCTLLKKKTNIKNKYILVIDMRQLKHLRIKIIKFKNIQT